MTTNLGFKIQQQKKKKKENKLKKGKKDTTRECGKNLLLNLSDGCVGGVAVSFCFHVCLKFATIKKEILPYETKS